MHASVPLPRSPFRVEFEIINSCNLNCGYCYVKPFRNITPEFEQLSYLFKKTRAEVNPFDVVILGGEPLIRKDIIEVLQLAVDVFGNASHGMSTNGTLLNKLTEEQFADLSRLSRNQLMVQVSLDSFNPVINSKTRGGTEFTLKGLKLLEEHSVPFVIGIVVTKFNKDDVLQTIDSLLKFTSLKGLNLERLMPGVNMNIQNYYEMLLTEQQYWGIHLRTQNLLEKSGRRDVTFNDFFTDYKTKNGVIPIVTGDIFRSCTAGFTRSGVLVDGSVVPCVMIRDKVIGNIYYESWKEIWNRSVKEFFDRRIDGSQCFHFNIVRKEENNRISESS